MSRLRLVKEDAEAGEGGKPPSPFSCSRRRLLVLLYRLHLLLAQQQQ
jgi:hypothetical protein